VNKFIRASAFFTKEILEVIRQPRLILTLIVGPFLILLLFGIGYQSNYPPVRTVYLVPPGSTGGGQLAEYMKELGSGLTYVGTVDSSADALRRLKDRTVDMVVVAPQDVSQALQTKQQLPFEFYYDEVDPLQSDHLSYIAQLMVSVVNRHLVEQAVAQGQAGGADGNIPATVVAQPYQPETKNIAASNPSPAQFFAPAVIILLLQHLAVTFGALSIVRERTLGSLDLFRVSPLTSGETLAGKYLSYYLFGAIIAFLLVALLVIGFGVPMKGSWLLLGFALAVVLVASLGWGFVISGRSRNASQAIQYSMMVLLASFFFSGFVLSLRTLSEPVRVVSRLLPATYGIAFAQSIMLRGEGLDPTYLWSVIGLALFLMLLAWLFLRRNLRRA
jgi:ABC-2 type transport system permease protein